MKKRLAFLVTLMALAGIAVAAAGCTGGVGGNQQGLPQAYAATDSGNYSLSAFSGAQQQVGLWVSGEGKVMAVPDIAVVSVGVQAQASTVAEASAQARDAMNKVMGALSSNGVASKDIQTQYYNVNPIYRYDDYRKMTEIVGYQVDNSVTAKIRNIQDTERVGTIIDAVAEAGGDLTRIGSFYFTVEDPKPYQMEARAKAVQDAMAKAKQIADQAGVGLGKPIYIAEGASSVPIPAVRYFKAEAGAADSVSPTPISTGESEISVSVQMVFDLV